MGEYTSKDIHDITWSAIQKRLGPTVSAWLSTYYEAEVEGEVAYKVARYFDPERGKLTTFIYAIMEGVLARFWRTHARQPVSFSDNEEILDWIGDGGQQGFRPVYEVPGGSEGVHEAVEDAELVRGMLDRLTPAERRWADLIMDGLTKREAIETLGVTPQRCRQLSKGIKGKVQKAFAEASAA